MSTDGGMHRLIVTNSALAHPRVPDSVLRPGDEVLPLVERFEEALFMPGAYYDELRTLFPAFNFDVRDISRSLGALLPDRLGDTVPEWGHSAWEVYADRFAKFGLGPLLCNLRVAQAAVGARPTEVLAWEAVDDPGWWTGRQMVAEIASVIARDCGATLHKTGSALREAARDLAAPALPLAQALSELRRYRRAGPLALPPQADVVFPILAPTLVPLYDLIGTRLQDDHGLSVIGVDLPHGGPPRTIAPGKLPRFLLRDLVEPWMIRRGMMEAAAGPWAARDLARELRQMEPFAAMPRDVWGVLTRRVHVAITRDLTLCALYVRLWERALDLVRPRVLVSFNTYNELMAPGVLQSRHRGVPTMCAQHGIWGPLFRAAALLPYDEVLVFGDYARDMLEPLADPETLFTATGHSLYDTLSDAPPAPAPREELLDGRRHLVLVTTQPIEMSQRAYEQRWWLEVLAEACRALDARVLIKPHPREEELGPYREVAQRRPEHVRLVEHGEFDLSALIAASDLLVTRFSTTAIEAALMETPVMTVNLAAGLDQYPFAEEGAAVGVYAEEELLPTLRRLLTDEELRAELTRSQKAFLERHLGVRDGRATERIAARIAARARSG